MAATAPARRPGGQRSPRIPPFLVLGMRTSQSLIWLRSPRRNDQARAWRRQWPNNIMNPPSPSPSLARSQRRPGSTNKAVTLPQPTNNSGTACATEAHAMVPFKGGAGTPNLPSLAR